MKLVITGASGQLARRAAELVLATAAPADLILTTRTPAALADFAARGVTVRRADFAEPGTLRAAFSGAERLLLVSATDLVNRTAQHEAAIDAAKAAGVAHVIYTSGLKPAPPNPAVVAPSHFATEQALARSGLDVDDPAQQPLRRLSSFPKRSARSRPACSCTTAAAAASRTWRARTVRPLPPPCCCSRGTTAPCTRSRAASPSTRLALVRLYAKLGGRAISERSLDDAAFVASLVGDAASDDHLRYGAELVASFGRSIREGYMDSRTDAVAKLTGRAPLTLERVLAPAKAIRSR